MTFFQQHPKVVIGCTCIVLLFALIIPFRSEKPPEVVQEVFSTLYKDWAQQAEQLGDVLQDGSRVVVMDLDRELLGFDMREVKRILDALEGTGISIEHVEKLLIDESKGWVLGQPGFPYSEFARVAEEYPDIDAVIVLCGSPYGTHLHQGPDPSELPKLLVAGGPDGGYAKVLFDNGWLHAATVPRTEQIGGRPVITYELIRRE